MRNIFKPICKLVLLCTVSGLLANTARAQENLGTVEVATIGHAFGPFVLNLYSVGDALINQRQNFGGGGVLPSVNADFDGQTQFVLTISAPPGMRFLVQPPAGQSVRMSGSLLWQAPTTPTPNRFGTLAINFADFVGTPLSFGSPSSALTESRNVFGFNDFQSALFTGPISFSAITLVATVPASDSGFDALDFTPSDSSNLEFWYVTSQTIDPGAFVSIVPEPSIASLLLLGITVGSKLAKVNRANRALRP